MKLRNSPGYKNERRIRAKDRIELYLAPIKEAILAAKESIRKYKAAIKDEKAVGIRMGFDILIKKEEQMRELLSKQVEFRAKELMALYDRIMPPEAARARRTKKFADGRRKPQGKKLLLVH